ncbi:8342_t:CDS:2, partial [Acaulospora morrowiae]
DMELLPADCLREIFKVLQDDTSSLYSKKSRSILKILVTCLPETSKNILLNNNIDVSSFTSRRPLLFHYVRYIQSLSFKNILHLGVTLYKSGNEEMPNQSDSRDDKLKHQVSSRDTYCIQLILQEFFKMFMSQCVNFKFLDLRNLKVTFPYFLGADKCLMGLRELQCDSKISSEIFCRLAQICRNLEHISVECHEEFDNLGLAVLIECQRNLKKVELVGVIGSRFYSGFNLAQSVAKQANSVHHLLLKGETPCIPLSIISPCINIRILDLHFEHDRVINIFDDLESISFPNLRVLRAGKGFPRLHILEGFIEKIDGCLEELVIYGERPPITEPRLEFNRILTSNCRKLRVLTLWCMTLNLNYVKEILISCRDLEILSIHSCIEYEARRVFEVLKDSAPTKLSRLRLEGRWIWENSATALVEFLEFWKDTRLYPSVFYLQ